MTYKQYKQYYQDTNFDKKRYRQLLICSKELEAKGEKLSDVSQSEYKELRIYFAKLWDHLEWESLDRYVELIKSFLEDKICLFELSQEISNIRNSNDKVIEALESNLLILSPNPNSVIVAGLISNLNQIFEQQTFDSILSLEQLQSLVEENKFDKACKEYDSNIYNHIKQTYIELEKLLEK